MNLLCHPRITRLDTKIPRNEGLTNRAVRRFTPGTSLLCVSTAGREAGFTELALAFLEKESAERPFGPRPGQESPALDAGQISAKGWRNASLPSSHRAELRRRASPSGYRAALSFEPRGG